MKTLWIDWNKPELSPKNLTLSLGGFDGIHLGHQFLIKKIVQKAQENKTASALCIFDPLPFQVLRVIKPFKRLLTVPEMENLLLKLGLDYFCIIPFNKKVSKIKPKDFMDSFLMPHFQAHHILVGYDFSFAHKKEGDFSFLNYHQKKYGFTVEKASTFLHKGQVVSSSLVRKHLKQGNIKEANNLLGYPFFIESKVIKGEGRGKKLGFPTANLKLNHKEQPCFGVYKAAVKIKDHKDLNKHFYKAVVNIGCRPTFNKNREVLVEVHIPEISQNLYGKNLKIELEDFIRKERAFKNFEDLKKQIEKDIKKIKKT